jgi:hypothetical protein
MTKHEQEAGATSLRDGSILQHLLMPLSLSEMEPYKGWSPGVAARAGMVGFVVGNEAGLGQKCENFRLAALAVHWFEVSLHVPTSPGESANDELLSEAGADPFCSTDCKIPKDKADATIRPGKIKIREAG